MLQKIVKGLLMTASLLFADFQTSGNISTASVIVAVAFLLSYYAKNWWFPSVSEDGVFDWRDITSAILVALSVAIPDAITQIVVDGVVMWKELLMVTGTVVFTYFTGTYFSKAKMK